MPHTPAADTEDGSQQTNPQAVRYKNAFGVERTVRVEDYDKWMDGLLDEHEEIMHQPLSVGKKDSYAKSLSPFAFCAPEVIRGAITTHIIETHGN